MRYALLLASLISFGACTHAKEKPDLTRKGEDRGLYVGHTNTGVLVVAARHYDAMNGLAVLAGDVDAADYDEAATMLCRREVVTGSHYPQWICRHEKDHERISEMDRNRARMLLQAMPQQCGDCKAQ
ncbi:MAG TPA: hypothetical protein VE755_08835 [Myxococcales bacterium]|jgi:hypothetical protein|nr:hypothetical protein [Myxococcales bacterium]